MSATIPVRLPRVIYDEASDVAGLQHRTVGQQLAYWAEIGRAVETSTDASSALIQRLLLRSRLTGGGDNAARAEVLADLDVEFDHQIASLDLRSILHQDRYIEADESGTLVERTSEPRP